MPAHGREAPGVGHSRSTGATADATGRSPRPGSPAPAVRPGFAEMPIYPSVLFTEIYGQFDCGPTSLDMASGGLERRQLSVAERIQIRRESKNELTALWLCGSVALWLCGSVAAFLSCYFCAVPGTLV